MNTLMLGLKRFMLEEDGVTAIEYGLIAALIAVVIIAAVFTAGQDVKNTFQTIANCLSSPSSANC